MTLQELKEKALMILRSRGIVATLAIHVSTELQDEIKANVQGNQNHYDIIINASLPFEMYPKAVAHELAHIILQTSQHSNEHQKLAEKLYKELMGRR